MVEQGKQKLSGETTDLNKLSLVTELQREVKALVSSKAGDLKAVCTIDPSDSLMRLGHLLKRPSPFVTLRLAKKVQSAVLKVAKKPKLGKGATIRLPASAVRSVRIVLITTMQALASTLAGGGRKSAKQLRAFAERCTNTMILCCGLSESPTGWKEALEYSRDAASVLSLSLESFLSEQNLAGNYQRIEQGIIDAVNFGISQGGTATLVDLSAIFRRHRPIKERVLQHVRSLISERAGTMPNESQAWALRELGLSAPEATFEYSDPADSPEIKQAASLLMFMFDEQARNAEVRETFGRFRSLCEMHFHLFLRGTVGGAVNFDSRLHEPCEDSGSQMSLVRPWVEWYLPPDARIVIRGIVEPMKREGGTL